MKVTRGSGYDVCVIFKAGYWETGVLGTFFRTDSPDHLDLPAYVWLDNCDYDPVANCYQLQLKNLYSGGEEEVYIQREYVLVVMVHKQDAAQPKEMGKIGFKSAAELQQ